MSKELKQLKHRRGTLEAIFNGEVDILVDLLDNEDEHTATRLPVTLAGVEKSFQDLSSVYDKILMDPKASAEIGTFLKERSDLRWKFASIKDRATAALAQLSPQPVATKEHACNHQERVSDVKLPTIQIEPFSGDYTQWPAFCDMFTTLVHSKTHLSGAEKLQLLKNSLRGNAAKKIANITVTHDNYTAAWNLLKSVYENKRVIVSKLYSQLTGVTPLTNARSLPDFVDSLNSTYRALNALKMAPDLAYSYLLCHIAQSKLDGVTAQSWEEKQSSKIPMFEDLLSFLQEKVAHIEIGQNSQEPKNQVSIKERGRGDGWNVNKVCPACQQQHKPYSCDIFKRASVAEKFNLIKASRRCLNCLEPGHSSTLCRASSCRKCGKKHNTMLHDDKHGNSSSTESSKPAPPSVNTMVSQKQEDREVSLLGTAKIYVLDTDGTPFKVRALLDPGSQSNIITEECARKLNISLRPSNGNISGIGDQGAKIKGTTAITIKNNNGDFTYEGQAIVMDKITCDLPQHELRKVLQVAKGLDLADEEYSKPGPIDVLLGVDIYAKAFRRGLRHPRKGEHNTAFGWVIMGNVSAEMINLRSIESQNANRKSVNCAMIDPSRLWAMEEVPKVPIRTREDKECEQFYASTTKREKDGRYTVRLPLLSNPSVLGGSRQQAVYRFNSLERKFRRDPEFAAEYKKVIKEYIDLGHIEEVPLTEKSITGYYIPHHAVVKESSKTTRLRVVFDASAKTTNGKSLNDILMTGPRIQEELFHILIRFRTHTIALTADIEKMYRMILMHKEDRSLQRIVWRASPQEPLRDYQLTRVSFGVKTAPFLAIRTIHQLAEDEEKNYPMGSKILTRDFYVDDLLTGADTLDEVKLLQSQLQQVLAKGGFNITKWTTNEPKALAEVMDCSESPVQVEGNEDTSKTLGLQWQPTSDQFQFEYKRTVRNQHTKRSILSDIAKLFDPLGWLAPVTIKGKIIFQQLWRINTDWDTAIPENIQKMWNDYRKSMEFLDSLKIERCIKPRHGTFTLCGFSDASEAAYGACVYLRTHNENEVQAHLIAAKTKVASLHATPLPRLELCGALLLAQLMESVESALHLKISEIHGFTDSSITLQWITNANVRWKAFVANRVSAIHDAIPHAKWHHIPGNENIADCITRGILPADLIEFKEWWYGPARIYQPLLADAESFMPTDDARKESRSITVLTSTSSTNSDDYTLRFSKFARLLRVTALVLRFIKSIRKQSHNNGHITIDELEDSKRSLIKKVQSLAYPTVARGKSIPEKLQALHPVLDENMIIRVGGRLRNANISTDHKQPILLPKDAHISLLIVRQVHENTLHGGPQIMIATIRQQYWIMGLKHLVKKIYNSCVRCQRLRAQTCLQLMGELPKSRVTQARPFARTGCDFMGPFWIKTKVGRCAKRFKAYVALFVCFTTRATHLEYVSDMTTQSFLAALKRFIARRGKPSDMYSDLGTNFVGGNNELERYLQIATTDTRNKEVAEQIALMGIKWHFNPGGAPHFGGLWEAGVKSTKYHLKRIVGDSALTFEELNTVLCQVEAVLNSRPLVEMSSDPSDYVALTPGHFLVGGPLIAHPEPNVEGAKPSHLSRWSLLQQMVQHFWRRWHNEYLTRLQQRPKWARLSKNLQAGELVLLKEDNLPPLQWKLARIIEVHPGADGHIRVVTVQTTKGSYKRPITKVCRLWTLLFHQMNK